MRKKLSKECIICGGKYFAKKYCHKHYAQIKKHRKILKQTRFDPNKIIDYENCYEIVLCGFTKNGEEPKEIARALIDKEDLEKVKDYKWCLDSDGYVITIVNKKIIRLHHLIFAYPPPGYEVDHRDINPLNNRKCNLRFATSQQNSMNRKSKGYYWDKRIKKWIVYINIKGKHIHLGCFINKKNAVKVRKEAELKYFGEFAPKR